MALREKILEYFTRKSDLRVLFIFDPMEERVPELSEIAWPEDYHYEIFDGGSFRVKYNLQHDWKNLKVVLLVKGTSPADESSRSNFPLLDVLASNMEFKNDSAELYMQERGIKHDLVDYIKRNISKLQRKKNDELLVGLYKDLTIDILNRSIISAEFDSSKLLDWTSIFVKLVVLGRELNAKKRERLFITLLDCKDVVEALGKAVERTFGYKIKEGMFDGNDMVRFFAKSLKYNSLCGGLPLTKGDVYAPFKKEGSLEALNAVWDLGFKTDPAFEDAIEEVAADIRESYILTVYGPEADYFRLTPKLAYPIAEALLQERIWLAPAEVNERIRSMLNKTNDNGVICTLSFLSKICEFYALKDSLKIEKLNDPMEYVQAYVEEIFKLDTLYRQALEFFIDLEDDNPARMSLDDAKKKLDGEYAKFCHRLNLQWGKSIEKEGLEKIRALRQESFYKTFEKPGVKLVVIVSDALRYELGVELIQELHKSKHHPRLEYALAQLPTETKYCKTALLPHETLGFSESDGPALAVDGCVLVSTEQRESQASKFVPEAKCINFKDLDFMDLAEKRELFKHQLVYVFHDAVDDSGHDHNPKVLSRACRSSIEDIAKLVHSLHSTMNVYNVVITADHGFLYNDIEFAEKDKISIAESCLEKKTRYYLTKSASRIDGILKFPLSKVSGMKNSDVYVATPLGTNRMAAPGGYNFAHGGAALQELVIPVIVSSYKRDDEKQKVSLTLLDSKLKMTSSILKIQILQKEAVSKEYKERTIVCGVYDNDKLVTEQKQIALNSVDDQILQKRLFEVKLALNKYVSSSLLELRIYDVEDTLNPIVRMPVTNDTLIGLDF